MCYDQHCQPSVLVANLVCVFLQKFSACILESKARLANKLKRLEPLGQSSSDRDRPNCPCFVAHVSVFVKRRRWFRPYAKRTTTPSLNNLVLLVARQCTLHSRVIKSPNSIFCFWLQSGLQIIKIRCNQIEVVILAPRAILGHCKKPAFHLENHDFHSKNPFF